MLAGGAIMLAVGVLRGELASVDPSSVSTASVLAVLYLIIFGSLVAFTAYIWLLNNIAIGVVSTSAYVNPIVAVALGVVILGETLTPRTVLAAVIIIGGHRRVSGAHAPPRTRAHGALETTGRPAA
jgi:drug/metabolite transporter (DMT)-like permease